MRLDPAEPPERGPHSRGGKEGNRPDRDDKGRGGYRDDDRGYPDGRAGPSSSDRYDLPPPTGVALPPGASATDAISETLATMPPSKLLDIMTEMKVCRLGMMRAKTHTLIWALYSFIQQALVKTSPEQARALLNANPQLAYALFQAMLMMNIVDPVVLQVCPLPYPGIDQTRILKMSWLQQQRMLAPAQGAPPPLAQPAPFAPAVPPPVAPAPYPYPSAASAVPVIPPPAPVYQAPPPVAAVPPQPVDVRGRPSRIACR